MYAGSEVRLLVRSRGVIYFANISTKMELFAKSFYPVNQGPIGRFDSGQPFCSPFQAFEHRRVQ